MPTVMAEETVLN